MALGGGDGLDLRAGRTALDTLDEVWTALADQVSSPFLTAAWLRSWWEHFGRGDPVLACLRDRAGSIRAAAFLVRGRTGLSAPVNDHSGHWGAVAQDPGAAATLWRHVAARPGQVLTLAALADGPERAAACAALRAAGRRPHVQAGLDSPYVTLPSSFDELLARRSGNLRSQIRRRRKRLERQGAVRMRTLSGSAAGDRRAVEAFLSVEGSGWKARSGTAILANARTARLYRSFARRAATDGLLRVHLLELDGATVAADLACVVDGVEFLIKTGFDETYADLSPGTVLRAEVLRAAIEDGLRGYDFLGGPDAYKLRWTDERRRRVTVRGFRGVSAVPTEAWWRWGRPALAAARRHAHERGTARRGGA